MVRKITDYVSGILVNEGPEERITQLLSHHLIDTLGYEREQIRTRPQWRIPKSPGAARSGGFPADLVVLKDAASYQDPDGVFMIFECKAASHKFTENDEKEIKLYLQNEPAARIGVLFNGLGGHAEEGQTPFIVMTSFPSAQTNRMHVRRSVTWPSLAGNPPGLQAASFKPRGGNDARRLALTQYSASLVPGVFAIDGAAPPARRTTRKPRSPAAAEFGTDLATGAGLVETPALVCGGRRGAPRQSQRTGGNHTEGSRKASGRGHRAPTQASLAA